MTEDNIKYLKAQVDQHYGLVIVNTTPRCFWGDKEKWTYHEYLFWLCRYLEEKERQTASELEFALICLARVKKDLGEEYE